MEHNSLGDLIIQTVIRAAALDTAIVVPDDYTIFIWKANAAEQIEAAVMEELAAYKSYMGQIQN